MITEAKEGSNVNQLTTLSLFIMLLAFFIVLNSKSNFEEAKTRPVIRSIERTFAAKVTGYEDSQSSDQESETQSVGKGNIIDQLDAFFNAEFPALEVKKVSGEDILAAEVNKLTFLNEIRENSAEILKLRDLINTYFNSAKSYVMEITFHFDQAPSKIAFDNPQKYRQALDETENIVAGLQNTGFQEKGLALNFFKGDEATLTLVFRTRPDAYSLATEGGSDGE